MKKAISFLLALVFICSLSACGGPSSGTPNSASATASVETSTSSPASSEAGKPISDAYDFVRIGTASLGGNFYNWGSAIAQLLIEKMGCDASSQATNGSAANCYLVRDGEVEIALCQGNTLYEAVSGTGNFEGETFSTLRSVGTISFNVYHVMVRTDAKIETIEDLRGKRIAMGPVGGGVEISARKFLEAYGINDGDFSPIYGTVAEMHEQMKTGQIDAYVNAVAAGTAQTTDTLSDSKITLLPMSKEDVDRYVSNNPDVGAFTIPAGTYADQNEDIYTMGSAVIIFVDASMPEEFAYEFTKHFYEENEFLMSYNSGFSNATPQNALVGLCLPLHSGSERYLKEIGIIK